MTVELEEYLLENESFKIYLQRLISLGYDQNQIEKDVSQNITMSLLDYCYRHVYKGFEKYTLDQTYTKYFFFQNLESILKSNQKLNIQLFTIKNWKYFADYYGHKAYDEIQEFYFNTYLKKINDCKFYYFARFANFISEDKKYHVDSDKYYYHNNKENRSIINTDSTGELIDIKNIFVTIDINYDSFSHIIINDKFQIIKDCLSSIIYKCMYDIGNDFTYVLDYNRIGHGI